MSRKLLVIDDDQVFCSLLTRHFDQEYGATGFSDPEEAVKHLRKNRADVVLTDLSMPKMDGMEVLKAIKSDSPGTDVILMTAYAQVETAVEAMKQGAYDYIVKPFTTDELSLQLKNLFDKRRLRDENAELKKFVNLKYRPENIIGKSQAIKDICRFIERVSGTAALVLITGESGTGKELVARAIHFSGSRKERRLFTVHCGAIEFAPGGADKEIGLLSNGAQIGGNFERAEWGTLVLREIGDMDIAVQAKFLAFIDTGSETIGRETQPMIIATSNKDLSMLQREGKFRQDLFHRLNTFSLRIPPLRERKEDIPLLAEHFFSQYKDEFDKHGMRMSPEAVEVLQNYDWPGNIRELKGLFAAVCLLEDTDVVGPEHLLERLPKPQNEVLSLLNSFSSLPHIEKNLIIETLRRAKGNMMVTSKLLNISYETLRYRMKKFGIRQKAYKAK